IMITAFSPSIGSVPSPRSRSDGSIVYVKPSNAACERSSTNQIISVVRWVWLRSNFLFSISALRCSRFRIARKMQKCCSEAHHDPDVKILIIERKGKREAEKGARFAKRERNDK